MQRIGSALAHYRLTAALGAGGMGEVYRATDSRLDREVAIKVLPAAFTADPERLARFEREAKLLAQLHHPNIAAIHGLEEADGTRALVMELVEGEDLAAIVARGPLPLDEALAIARQIADALEAAHEHGIVHRDLKPANVKVRPDGTVKVLDFGLAKALDPSAGTSSATAVANSPTLTAAHGTQLGMVLGTAAYMAPEQARGGAVDKRADVWAFGVVLWEMLTGRRLFAGETVSDTLASVLRGEIDLDALPVEVPREVRYLLRRCLERNPRARLRDVGEARIALDPATPSMAPAGRAFEPDAAIALPTRRDRLRRALPWVLAAVLAGAALWTLRGGLASRPPAPTRSPTLAVHLPAATQVPLDDRGIYGQTAVLAIAPDGSRLVFVAGPADSAPLYVRELDGAELRQLEGTAGASSPFFSPDGRWVGYFSPGKLRKLSIEGGRPIDLAEASLDRGAVWCPDGSIVYSPNAASGLFRLPPSGGAPQPLTQVDVARGERTHRWPAVLPGGREVAFTIGTVGRPGDYEDAQIDAVDLATGKRRPLFRGGSMVRFTPVGIALLGREGQILAVPLAGADMERAEEPRLVVRNVAGIAASGVVHFDVAQDGTLVYAERDPLGDELELVWLDRDGRAAPLDLPSRPYRILRFAPDGKRVVAAVGPGGGRGGDIFVLDLASSAVNKLTFDGRSWAPVWSRDGRSVTYAVLLPDGSDEFRRRAADGSEEAVRVASFRDGRAREPVEWMPDGSLLFWEDAGAGSAGNVLYLPPGGGEPRALASTPAVEMGATVSPDGRYVAYIVDQTGRPDVHVQPFPPTGAKWVVAEDGSLPAWSADGRELFFNQGSALMSIPISAGTSFTAGNPRRLFELSTAAVLNTDTTTSYDVAPDGRILAARRTSNEPMGDHLVVVLNWFERLKEIR